ncbi:MAG: glycosyltransferase family 2 protein [Mucinivorans sp.]
MLPKISIITVVRNDPKGLELTLNNLSQVQYPSLEIIVIDGASSDSTPSVAHTYAGLIAAYLSEEDQGIYDAMNKGLALSTGDFVWFVNAGDTVCGVDDLVRLMTTDATLADVYYGQAIVVDQNGKRLGLRRKVVPRDLSWRSLSGGMVVSHQAFIVRRTIAVPYDLHYRYAADIEWQIECLRRARNTQYTGGALCCFAVGGVSTTHRKESLTERWAIMRRNYGLSITILSHIKFVFDAIFSPGYR